MHGPEKINASPQPQRLEALQKNPDEEKLAAFTPDEQHEISSKQKILSSLAYFVGKDFKIPVLLNEPGGGWYWDQEKNHIKVDPKDLLEKPMEYLRFVICHEAGHRRISRIIDVIPKEVWQQPGFPFFFNALEDTRTNTAVAEYYTRFKDQMIDAYDLLDQEHRAQVQAKAELGHQPKSMQAGFEYIKQWLKWYQWTDDPENREKEYDFPDISGDLPEEVKTVIKKTIKQGESSWTRFPTRDMADGRESDENRLTGEASITAHAKHAYKIDYEQIWPEFKKLVDQDIERQTQQEALQKAMEGVPKERQEGVPSRMLPQELTDKLSPEEKQELEKAMQDALGKAQSGTPSDQAPQAHIDLDDLS